MNFYFVLVIDNLVSSLRSPLAIINISAVFYVAIENHMKWKACGVDIQ